LPAKKIEKNVRKYRSSKIQPISSQLFCVQNGVKTPSNDQNTTPVPKLVAQVGKENARLH
jgi:hypothetical protein